MSPKDKNRGEKKIKKKPKLSLKERRAAKREKKMK